MSLPRMVLAAAAGCLLAACGGGEEAAAPPLEEAAPVAGAAAPAGVGDAAAATPAAPARRLDAGRSLTGSVSGLSGAASDLGATVTETEVVVALPSDVLFEFDRAEIQLTAVPTLRRVVEWIDESPAALVTINGHTDALGSDAYNQSLSEARARAVAEWLAGPGGVDAARLRTAGFGAERPVAPNQRPDGTDDPAGRERNRRVEVVLPRD